MKYNLTNEILEEHDNYYVVDVSTNKFPQAQMLIDKPDWDSIINNPIYGRVSVFKPGDSNYCYARLMERQKVGRSKQRLIHRLVCPEFDIIDHANLAGDATGLDNRRENLRESSHITNAYNRHVNRNNKSGVRGVCVLKGKAHTRAPYQAGIIVAGVRTTKCFATMDAASLWRKEQELAAYGHVSVTYKR